MFYWESNPGISITASSLYHKTVSLDALVFKLPNTITLNAVPHILMIHNHKITFVTTS